MNFSLILVTKTHQNISIIQIMCVKVMMCSLMG